MKKLLNKIGVDLANKIINKFPISAPRNALLYYINKGKERKRKKEKKVVLDSVTVLDDNKALLTYKSDKSYYTKKN